jgi:hypothetical protein
MPDAVERDVRLRLEEVVGLRKDSLALCSTVVPREPVFDSGCSGWLHIVLVG